MRRLLIPLLPVMAVLLSGCDSWDYTMIRDEFKKCVKVADNRMAGGQALQGAFKGFACTTAYTQKLIDRFGTDDLDKIPDPIW
jgi:hypothetical protein